MWRMTPGPLDLRGGIDDAADDPPRLDTLEEAPARVHAVQYAPFAETLESVKVPPGDPVLGGQHQGVVMKEGAQIIDEGRELVRLDAQDDEILDTAGANIRGGGHPVGDMFRAVAHHETQARELRMASRCGPRATSVTS